MLLVLVSCWPASQGLLSRSAGSASPGARETSTNPRDNKIGASGLGTEAPTPEPKVLQLPKPKAYVVYVRPYRVGYSYRRAYHH